MEKIIRLTHSLDAELEGMIELIAEFFQKRDSSLTPNWRSLTNSSTK